MPLRSNTVLRQDRPAQPPPLQFGDLVVGESFSWRDHNAAATGEMVLWKTGPTSVMGLTARTLGAPIATFTAASVDSTVPVRRVWLDISIQPEPAA